MIIFVDHKIYTCKLHWTYKNKNIYIKNYRRKKNKPYCSSQQIGYMKTTVHKNNWYRRWKKIKIFIKLLFSCQFLKKTYIKKKVVHRIFYYIFNRTNWRFNNAKVHISSETFLLPNIEAVAQTCPVKKGRATLLKKRLLHRCFPVNFAEFLRTPFFTEYLWWLLLQIIPLFSLIFRISKLIALRSSK